MGQKTCLDCAIPLIGGGSGYGNRKRCPSCATADNKEQERRRMVVKRYNRARGITFDTPCKDCDKIFKRWTPATKPVRCDSCRTTYRNRHDTGRPELTLVGPIELQHKTPEQIVRLFSAGRIL